MAESRRNRNGNRGVRCGGRPSYALFTVVGIAGEDDLDAPDLVVSAKPCKPPTARLRTDQPLVGLPLLRKHRRPAGRDKSS
jgi:hypothetical protein